MQQLGGYINYRVVMVSLGDSYNTDATTYIESKVPLLFTSRVLWSRVDILVVKYKLQEEGKSIYSLEPEECQHKRLCKINNLYSIGDIL